MADADGVGTADGVYHGRAGAFAHLGTEAGVPDLRAKVLAPARGGGVWLGGRNGIARWNGSRFEREDERGPGGDPGSRSRRGSRACPASASSSTRPPRPW